MNTKVLFTLCALAIAFALWQVMSSGFVSGAGTVEPSGYKVLNVETNERFRIDIDTGFAGWPAECPDTGEKTCYPAEVCKKKACKRVENGTWVVLNSKLGKEGPTLCPHCGSEVRVHNESREPDMEAAAPPGDSKKKKPRRRGRRRRGGS